MSRSITIEPIRTSLFSVCSSIRNAGLAVVVAASVPGCECNDSAADDDDSQGDASTGDETGGETGDADSNVAQSTRAHLIWKRFQAVEADLARALDLPPAEICHELGQFNCTRQVHLTALGGHDPYRQGLYKPVSDILTTTPLAFDRVVLAACARRLDLDTKGPSAVFVHLNLQDVAPQFPTPEFTHTVISLYQRLLSRDPTENEIEVLQQLSVDDQGQPVSAREFAHNACYAIGSSAEFLFL